MGHVQSSDPVAWSGYTEQLADWPECPMTQAAGLYRPTGGGKLCVLCVSESALAICLQMPAAVVLTPISSLPQTHLYRNMKSRLELASGTLMLFFFSLFALVSTPLQAEKHLSSKSPQTTTVLNLIKDIADNRRAIKQQSFQRSTRAYIPLAQRVTTLSFTSQRFFKVISPLCVPPPPPLPVNQLMLVVWNNSFNGYVCYLTLNKDCSSWLQFNVWVKWKYEVIVRQLLRWTGLRCFPAMTSACLHMQFRSSVLDLEVTVCRIWDRYNILSL